MHKAVIPISTSPDSPASYEDIHVHTVYNHIAHHFSSTRYKPWPVVAAFLASVPAGHIGLDAGCGNGKYLIAPDDREGLYWTIGLDRSSGLLDFAKNAGGRSRECVLSDVLDTPWRDGAFDFAISIATIHHLSTLERRKKSIQNLLKCLSPSHGRGLIYVWSVRQDELSKRSVPRSTQGADEEHKGQDVFVPWVLSESTDHCQDAPETPAVFDRYYHMFDKGELRELVVAAAAEMNVQACSPGPHHDTVLHPGRARRNRCIEIIRDDWERSNYYVEFRLYQQ